jgi:hypothetical protein
VQPEWLLPPYRALGLPRWNYSNVQFRGWWVGCAVDALRNASGALDGLFLDAMPKLTEPGLPANVYELWGQMVDEIRQAVPTAWIIFNGCRDDGNGGLVANASLLQHTSAVYVEDMASLGSSKVPVADAQAYIQALAGAARIADQTNKTFVGHGFAPMPDPHDALFLFGYGVFLMTVASGGPRELFLANSGYEIDQGCLTSHAAYGIQLGRPTAEPVTVNATALRRTFEHGTVEVDLQAQRATIQSAYHM